MKGVLVIGIIFLFVGIALFPCITAADKDTDMNNEGMDNSKIESLDDYKEIITWIEGLNCRTSDKGHGFFIHFKYSFVYSLN